MVPHLELSKTISFIKSFPINVPVFITCSYPNFGDVRMLVIPEYYHSHAFKCSVLIIYPPYTPEGLFSITEKQKEICIDIDTIKSYKPMHLEKSDEDVFEEIETLVTI